MRQPFSPIHLLLFVFAIGFLLAFVQFGLISLTFQKLGLSPGSAIMLLFASLIGSAINLPLFTIRVDPSAQPPLPPPMRGLLRHAPAPFRGRTLIAVNVGGCIIPLSFCLYLFAHAPLQADHVILAVTAVAAVSYALSRPIAGLGIGMPMFVAPVTAAIIAISLGGKEAPSLAYIAGTLGVLIGADLLRLRDVGKLATPIAAIGGAGTFDGIFLSGLVAVLLS